MAEKRFTIGNVLTKCSGLRDNGKLMTFNEVVDLLNEQHETIQSLKLELELSKPLFSRRQIETELKELKEIGDYQAGRIKELTDENEQLKQSDTIADLETQISKLKYENELLKDELEQCKVVIDKKWSEYLQKKGLIE